MIESARREREQLEAARGFGNRGLDRQALHARGSIETNDANGAVENVLGIVRLRDRAAVTENEHVGIHLEGSVGDRLHALDRFP